MCVCTQSCLTFSDPVDCSLPCTSVREVFQARILEWVAISYSRGSSWPRYQTSISCISCMGRQVFYHCAEYRWQVANTQKNLNFQMAFRERFLLIGWWWGNLESQSTAFSFQPGQGLCACGQHTVNFFSLVGDSVSAKELKGFGSVSKESACSAGDPGFIPGLGRSPGEGNGNTLQYPCLENLRDRGAWWAAVHGVAKSRTL